MPRKEKFGKFVLLDEVESSGLGAEYRAAKLSPTGLEKIVTVLRVRPALSASPETVKSLMDQVKFAAQLQNPNIVKLFGIGKVDSSFYISHEFIEGKSLQAVFARGKQEGFPFSVDHALLIVSKVCAALEYAHARKTEGGVRYFHGLVTPANVIVSYEGEVRTRGFGYWPARIREAGGLTDEETLALAPEQAAGGVGDTRSDLFAVGALLFQMITGEPFFEGGRDVDVARRLADAKLLNPTTDDDNLPKPIREILRKSLTQDPAVRFAEVQEMRKALDALLFSGDFAPTTFNLAFFMHSLFREDIDREAATLSEEREASYADYITEEVRSAPATLPPMAAPSAAALAAAGAALSAPVPTPSPAPFAAVKPAQVEAPAPHSPAPHAAAHHAPEMSARDAAAGFTFHKEEKAGGKGALIGGLAAVVLIGAGAAFYMMKGRAAPPPAAVATVPPTTMSPEAVAALARVKELEEKLQAIETEKAAAAAKAEEDARKKVEAQAAARGQAVDPAALARAQEEARKKSQAEQERKAQVERQRLEEEQRMAEAQLAEERRRAEEARLAAAAAAPATPPPPVIQAAVATPPPVTIKLGALVDVNDAGVIAPVALNKPSFTYPPIALRQRIEGKIDLTVLVDERGTVADTRVIAGAGGRSGLNEAASDYVRRWKFRAATKDGVAVKTWTNVSVVFMLPR